MKAFKKQIPSILYAVLLLAIAILCIFIANNTVTAESGSRPTIIDPDKLTEAADTNDKNNGQTPDNGTGTAPDNNIGEENKGDENSIPPKEEEEVKKYSDKIPRNAKPSENFLYTQKIYGDGKTRLKNVFQTSVGTYIIATSDSNEGDICGKSACTGIVKIDTAGNIINALSLNYEYAEKYIASAISPLGLIVLTAPEKETFLFVNIISYDLDYSTPYRLSNALSATIMPTQNSFLIFAEYSNECVVYSFTGTSFEFQSIGTGTVTELFEYGNYYTVFTNNKTSNSYSIIKLSKNKLSIISETTVENAQIEGIFPINEDGTQNFILLENNRGIYAKKTNSSFTQTLAEKKLGNFTLENCYQSEKGILLVCNGNITGVALVENDLSTSFSESDSSYMVKDILDSIYTGNKLYYLAVNYANELSLVFSSDNKTTTRYFQVTTQFAKLVFNLNNTFTIIYQNDDDIEIFGIPEY